MSPKVLVLFLVVLELTVYGGNAQERYDFIVVGAGTAGSVMANRLSEGGRRTVLLLEAGGEPHPVSEVPALASVMYATDNTQTHHVEAIPNFGLGLNNNQIVWQNGRGLGGTSLINYMYYIRGFPRYFDEWAAQGNPGWSYREVLPYFRKFENLHTHDGNIAEHGVGGELDITRVGNVAPITRAILQGFNQSGYRVLDDYNTANSLGVGLMFTNRRDGRRCSTEKAFLRDIRYTRSNLRIETNAKVTRVLINTTTNSAEGVEYLKSGTKRVAKASREVILSAGTVSSPHILMLSGIGPREQLERAGIDVVRDLRVGATIDQHKTFLGLVFEMNDTAASYDPTSVVNPNTWRQFLENGTGFLTIPGLTEAVGFFNTGVTDGHQDYPDLELLVQPVGTFTGILRSPAQQWNVSPYTYHAFYGPLEGRTVWEARLVLLRPKPYFRMELNPVDPLAQPRFYGYRRGRDETNDEATLMAGVRILEAVAKSPAVAKYGSRVHLATVPGCRQHERDSDGYWACHFRYLTMTSFHETGTCRMGPEGDPLAVTDHRLRVRGVAKLRVADASVVPLPVVGHPAATVMMIGAKGAEMILEDHDAGGK